VPLVEYLEQGHDQRGARLELIELEQDGQQGRPRWILSRELDQGGQQRRRSELGEPLDDGGVPVEEAEAPGEVPRSIVVPVPGVQVLDPAAGREGCADVPRELGHEVRRQAPEVGQAVVVVGVEGQQLALDRERQEAATVHDSAPVAREEHALVQVGGVQDGRVEVFAAGREAGPEGLAHAQDLEGGALQGQHDLLAARAARRAPQVRVDPGLELQLARAHALQLAAIA
jgi:hypothetical protein